LDSLQPLVGLASEFRLALACMRWPLIVRDRAEIQQLASDSRLDWDWFVRIIERNQVLPLAYRNLREALQDGRRLGTLAALKDKVVGLTSHSLSQAAELVRISEAASSANIKIITLKGVSLSVVAYDQVALRSPGDIDLLIEPSQVFDFERVLMELGYIRYEPRAKLTPRRLKHYLRYYKHFAYICESKSVNLEVHWRLFHNTRLSEPEIGTLPTIKVPIGSSAISTLSRNELFLYLCVHGAVHGWPILKWLADIAALLRAMTTEDLRAVASLASERELMPELYAALELVAAFLVDERPGIELPRKAHPVTDRIVAMSKRLLTTHDYCLDIQELPRFGMFFYGLGIGPSWRYRSEDILRALVFPDDWDLIDLPDALFPLYAAVRPVSWLLRYLARLPRRQSTIGHADSHFLQSEPVKGVENTLKYRRQNESARIS